jgi:UDP-N-acetylglucosamine--N-acetylmuramyl-(pentapeptide) pyrophosphoryl-undecaprenol N-acetylglucosamine transferase
MKIVMTGGGSGGHITPILAVAHELKQLVPDAQVVYVGQTGDNFAAIVAEHDVIDEIFTVRAGKFRRYYGEGWRQLLDFHTMLLNIRDVGNVLVGLWQSFWLLGRIRPDVVFCKGGFISVPVGLAAALRRRPYLTHDSDVIPGLANRIIARWATKHAVALPEELYPYPFEKTIDVGVPVSHNYQTVTPTLQRQYRQALGLDKYKLVLLVTGGGLGAEKVNNAVLSNAPALLKTFPTLCIVHTAGHKHEQAVSKAYSDALPPKDRQRVIVRDYLNDLYMYSGAADVVVARGGGTSFAEFAQQGRACVIVPNPILTGGQQTKNAQAYVDKQAVVLVTESEIAADKLALGKAIAELFGHPEKRKQLERNIQTFSRPDAAKRLAELLIDIGTGGEHVAASQ